MNIEEIYENKYNDNLEIKDNKNDNYDNFNNMNYISSADKDENDKSKIKDIFSQKVSSKFIIFEPNYNKKLIKKILEQKKEIKVIEVLEKLEKDGVKDPLNTDFTKLK